MDLRIGKLYARLVRRSVVELLNDASSRNVSPDVEASQCSGSVGGEQAVDGGRRWAEYAACAAHRCIIFSHVERLQLARDRGRHSCEERSR